jgi:hypothetical protein
MKFSVLYTLLLLSLLTWNFAAKSSVQAPEVHFVTGGNLNVGSSVAGMPCPDPALSWPCSISSGTGKAPPPAGCMVDLGKNNQGRLIVRINKENLDPKYKADWIKGGKFYTPQTIEMERQLSLLVLDSDSAYYISPGEYPLTETPDAYFITF